MLLCLYALPSHIEQPPIFRFIPHRFLHPFRWFSCPTFGCSSLRIPLTLCTLPAGRNPRGTVTRHPVMNFCQSQNILFHPYVLRTENVKKWSRRSWIFVPPMLMKKWAITLTNIWAILSGSLLHGSFQPVRISVHIRHMRTEGQTVSWQLPYPRRDGNAPWLASLQKLPPELSSEPRISFCARWNGRTQLSRFLKPLTYRQPGHSAVQHASSILPANVVNWLSVNSLPPPCTRLTISASWILFGTLVEKFYPDKPADNLTLIK